MYGDLRRNLAETTVGAPTLGAPKFYRYKE